MSASDPFELERFVTAQGFVYATALAELKAGEKRTHWMWFVFPQLRALGRSPRAQLYGIGSLDEARAYLDHPLLGPRLVECTQAVLDCPAGSLHEIFGSPDDLKFKSCMTLFARAEGGGGTVFDTALDHWCAGERDQQTLALLD